MEKIYPYYHLHLRLALKMHKKYNDKQVKIKDILETIYSYECPAQVFFNKILIKNIKKFFSYQNKLILFLLFDLNLTYS